MKYKVIIIYSLFLILILSCNEFENYAINVKDKYCLTTQISSRIFDFNTFQLEVAKDLEILEFKVINRNSGKCIFDNGKSMKGIKNEYGYCSFDVFYKDQKQFKIGHYKRNNWETNNYILMLKVENNDLVPILEMNNKEIEYFVNKY